ncbi:hypothetical protein C2869_19725 [Saccharobesus litoralis]|uniref:Uncharacterized protein n=1 Tax=Saccharobesus litoralis TaxID=2172099 RepID=A0A2S0VWE2_9ALTE|nr:hypothetical protein [Saccharobesus litoralis]AWB68493.1 hypothetical protein C2869_19725 [Saccharobesus litoralis]
MNKLILALSTIATGLVMSSNALAAEKVFDSPRMVTTPYGYNLNIVATSGDVFCKAKGYQYYKNTELKFFPETSGQPHYYAIPVGQSANTEWKMGETLGGEYSSPYISKITCYSPEPVTPANGVFIDPTVNVNGQNLRFAETAVLNGWSLPINVIFCTGNGFMPGTQEIETIYQGSYAEYNAPAGGWVKKTASGNGINIVSKIECGDPM